MEKQIRFLVDLAKIDDPALKEKVVQKLLTRKLPLSFPKLVELMGHPCTEEHLQIGNKQWNEQLARSKNNNTLTKLLPESYETMSEVFAQIIGEHKLQTHYLLSGKPDPRMPKCVGADLNIPTKYSESDPFKGSQQGVGRTRKQKRNQKKTLRRRKIRRNMH